MAHDARPQRPEHLVLQVVVVLVQLLLGRRGRGGDGGGVELTVEVDGSAVDVVDGADEEVDDGGGGQVLDVRGEGRADELALEADEDVDLRGVEGLEALGLDEVGLVARGEDGEGVGIVDLFCGRGTSPGVSRGIGWAGRRVGRRSVAGRRTSSG